MSKARGALLPEGRYTDPSAEGAHAAADWRRGVELKTQGVESQLAACVRIYEAVESFGDSSAALAAFIQALVGGGVLSQAEGRRGAASPKLIKLKKIGEYASLLRREEMRSVVSEGYSALYQTVVLFESLPKGDDDQRLAQLLSVLQASTSRPTRQGLIEHTRRAKEVSPAAEHPAQEVAATPASARTLGDLIAADQLFDLVVSTPSPNDFRLLGADFPDLDQLEHDLPLFKVLAEGAAVVIVARESDLPVIVTKLLPLMSFERPSRVLLTQHPTTPDITDAEIIVIAHRRGASICLSGIEDWSGCEGPPDGLASADRLFPNAARKLHVFAEGKTDGWTSLVGEDTWIGPPGV